MTAIDVLEWSAFLLAFLSCLLYGSSVKKGAAVGIASSILCIIWGALTDVPAAVVVNIGFFFINGFNFFRKRPNAS
jgi:hypothetical protein